MTAMVHWERLTEGLVINNGEGEGYKTGGGVKSRYTPPKRERWWESIKPLWRGGGPQTALGSFNVGQLHFNHTEILPL